MVYERVTRLWIRMYVLWYKIKSRRALCTERIDRKREKERESESKRGERKIRERETDRPGEGGGERNESRI